MPIGSADATRILRFCLGADDSGQATLTPDGTCVVTIALCRASYEVLTFKAPTFEEALRAAGAAGAVKAPCIDKQIAFLSRGEAREEAPLRLPLAFGAPALTTPTPAPTSRFSFLELTDAVGALVHETQRERGMSTLFIGSGGRLLRADLREQWHQTDRRHSALVDLLKRENAAPPLVRRRLERAETLLSTVAPLRAGVAEGAVTPPLVIEAFNKVNAELLAAVDTFMAFGTLDADRVAAMACLTLLHAKEKTGIERAQLTTAFVEDRFTSDQRIAVAALIAAQSSYLHMFAAVAPRPAEQLLRRTLASSAVSEVSRMESVVFGHDDSGFGIDPSAWFTTITRKIDMLGEVAKVTLSLLREP
jgi:hypothetical protein